MSSLLLALSIYQVHFFTQYSLPLLPSSAFISLYLTSIPCARSEQTIPLASSEHFGMVPITICGVRFCFTPSESPGGKNIKEPKKSNCRRERRLCGTLARRGHQPKCLFDLCAWVNTIRKQSVLHPILICVILRGVERSLTQIGGCEMQHDDADMCDEAYNTIL